MKAGDALLAVLLFVFTIGLIQVSPAEVVYWESENDAENDYLKVKYRELVGHVMRFKRSGFDFLDTSTSTSLTTRENYDSTLEEDTAEDELDSDIGSGSPDRENADTEPREKTLRVTFVVIQPYHEEYNKRDSLQFKTFSTSLADAVNQLFDLLPGTQKASLVRIQSRISDEFTCKVTLDIVTTGYDDTDRIAKILRDHIRNKRALGSVAVNDNEFSANVVDSENCGADDFRCSNGKCIEASRRCDRIVDCPSNEDEKDCECRADEFTCLSDHSCIEVRKICDGVPNCSDSSDEADCACSSDQWQCDHGNCIKRNKRCDGRIDCPTDRSDERNCYECNHECDGRCLEDQQICNGQYDCSDDSDELHCDECDGPTDFRCKSSGECLNIAQRCNGVPECPDYSDEQGCNDSVTPVEYGCLGNQFQCHVGTCIDNEFVCDGNNDCIDNSDEENCPCTSNEFQCESGQCIRRSEYCDSIPQCTDGTDEQGCPTTRSWLTTTVYPTYHLPSSSYRPQTTYHSVSSIPVTISPLYSATAYPKPQLPESGFTELNLKIYPDQLSLKHGGDVVFQCRDEGPHRAPVRWVRQGGRPLKPGYTDRNGRLEMIAVSPADSGVYICQAIHYLGYPGAEVRVSLIVDPASPPRTPGIPPCHAYQATCGNGECIPKQAICDGNKDCTDGSDEDNCNPNGQCEPNQFKCANRKCVLKTWLCDYEDDCGDGSDEANCGSSVARPGECLAVEFTCHTKNQCVPKSFHCDSQSDCFDGSDEIGCAPIHVIKPPYPSNTRISAGKTLVLTCEAVGVPTPLISWRLNWGHVPQNCTSTSNSGIGVLTCHNMQPEHSGAYSCEAINNKGTTFASPDAIVYVNKTDVCPSGYFNSDARSESECIRCFCFGESTQCRSADLFTYNMPTPLGKGGTRLVSIIQPYPGEFQLDTQPITDQYYYQPLRNGATVTKLENFGNRWNFNSDSAHPYLTLPETYNGNQLTSYGGHIRYNLSPHSLRYTQNDYFPDIIIMGKYGSLAHKYSGEKSGIIRVEARLIPENWQKFGQNGVAPATREDIMMTLDNVESILLRVDLNNAGVNITEFAMESAQHINVGLGAANLVEECTCPPGYEGLSCQKCASGYVRKRSGPWLGNCVPEQHSCPQGTYGDPASGYACQPCPCPLTNSENQFARTCAVGPSGRVLCDCLPGYMGEHCEYCDFGYVGNPNIPGDSCRRRSENQCNAVGTQKRLPLDECQCKDNVQGRYCDQCKDDSFFLSPDFRHGCALCFCTGVTSQCTSSNLRRTTTRVRFNTPQIVNQVRVYSTAPLGLSGSAKYNAPTETNLRPSLIRGIIALTNVDRSIPSIYYWSLPDTFSGDKVTSYGGFLTYTLTKVPTTDLRNTAADVQLISENRLTFHYVGDFQPTSDGSLNATVQFLEKGWERPDGKEISRELFLLALADVKAILVKATYTNQPNLASLETASIDTAEPNGYGPPALHVEECRCPIGYIGTSCEDCAPGFTRSGSGLYLEQCGPCVCNGHSTSCHPETGACYDCRDNTAGENCQDCKPGYEKTPYGDCVPGGSSFTYSPLCSCDPRGEAGPCDETGTCQCKQNVEGTYCDTCRPGTFGLDRDEPLGCLSCYCSGITNECHEATHLSRFEMAAPIFGENYGGYTLTNLNGNQIISDQFVPDPTESELTYAFSFPPDEELYWSLPVFPGNRILSYGGVLSLTQKFETGGYPTKSTPGNDVILVGDAITVYWSNPTPIQPGKALSYQVPLRERGWYILNTATPASRNDILAALKSLRRVLVRATLTNEIVSTSIADVSMDTASEVNNSGAPAAKGIEICMCPEGYRGTSCESCEPGYYIDHFGMCRQCNCNGQDCELSPYNDVVCICRPPFTGAHCSTVGGESSIYDRPSTSFRPSTSEPTVFVRITSPTIKIEEVGKSVNFTCQAQSRVTPSRLPVRWTKAGGELPQDRSYVDRNSGMLLITDLRIPDSGKYICQANDGISTVQAIATLKVPGNVIKVPSLSIRPTAKEYYEGDRIALECQATGYPAPRIGWQRAGNLPLPRSAEAIEGLLIIESALEEDSGEYRCIASNAAGSSERVAVITVKPRPNMPRDKLSISPLAPSVPEGQKIRLVCIGSPSVPAGTIEWIRQDNLKFLPNVRSDNGVLYVDVAQIENQGIYTCQSTSPGIPPVSVLLSVIPLGTPAPTDEPKITVSRDNVTVPVGGFTSVDCNPQGYPKPLIKWRRMETEFGLGTSQRENSLIFTNAQESDEGYYMCEGSVNGNPVANIYIYVHIQTPPRVEIWPQGEQAVPLGSQFELRCHVTAGDSPTDITWARTDGRPLSPNTQITKNNVLSFEKIEVNDEGEYTCVGTNAAGKASASAVIKVRSPPEIVITPSNFVQAFSGETVTVECRASGYPEPLVSIRLGRREIVPQTPRIAVLRISSVTDRDEEDYVCTATSPAGTMEEQFAIRVNRGDGGDDGGGSGFEPVPDESAAIVAFEGEDKIMDCTTATGYNVVWRRSDNRPLQNNAIQTGSSLIINRASKSDSGQYECTVVDQFTNEPQKSAFTTLNVVTPPRITLRPKTQSVQPGQSPTVECIVDGDEITDIIWRGRYGGQLPGRVESRGSNLIFHQIELEDAGEYECIARNRFANATAVAEVIVSGPRGGSSSLVSIDQPRKSFREGETAEVLCRANSRGTRVNWERYTSNQQRQYVETRTYGDGSMLVVPGVRESDAGIYRCTGRDPYGYTAFEDFNLEIVPVNIGPSATLGNEDRVYTAELGADIEMPCTHDLEPPVAIEWRREYQPLPNNIRKDEPNIRLPLVAETDAGTYVCRVSNNRVAIETRAILRVVNVVPRFEGDGWISLPTIKDAYRQFDIEISFNPTDANGLIFYNSQNEGHVGDYVALQLVNGVPEFSFDASSGPLKIRGDRPLQMNTWHTIRISRINSKVTMTLDNTGPFVAESMAQWDVLELYQPLYIGGVPNYTQISDNLARATGFMGCVSMLILGREEKNIMLDAIEKHNVKECDTCVPNMCLNKGLCQPARNERGYMCLCAAGFAGMNCDRTGDACRPGLCGPGKCVDTSDGYKCACPVSFTGNNCQDKQQIEYPAFTGSAYLAIKAPQTGRYFQMAMKIKTSSPVGDGLIMYCAESARGYGAFTSLAVHAGKLEFRYDLGDGSTPVILTANRSLTPNEWTNIHIARIGPIVSLKINLIQQFEQKLESPQKQMHLETPMFVGGVDDSIILNNNTGVSGGFSGCIKDVMVYGENVDIINNSIDSANVQECSIYDRGDIPEVDSPCALCRNGGYCATADASSCTCMAGYTGLYCNNRLPAPSRRLEPRDSCEVRPCRNNGICKPDRFSRMNYTCDCPLGFAGTNCQMSFQLLQSVGFNGNGYLELPSEKLRYDSIDKDPVIIALAFHTTSDGVLLYQREAISDVNYGDYILLRVENGRLVLDWDFGSGHSSLVIDDFYVNDGERHMVIVTLNSDYSVYLNLDNEHSKTDMTGLSNLINADSNIFIGGIPDVYNIMRYPGLTGCIEQVELMDSNRSLNLGEVSIAGRNTQRCRDSRKNPNVR